MPRASERRQQYSNRAWQCQGQHAEETRIGSRALIHICQIAAGHYGPHVCWCECLFDEGGAVYDQMGMWGSTKGAEAHRPWE